MRSSKPNTNSGEELGNTELAAFQTPEECAEALTQDLPKNLARPYIELCLRGGDVPTIGIRFDPSRSSKQEAYEPLPAKFWAGCSEWDLEDLFDSATAICSAAPAGGDMPEDDAAASSNGEDDIYYKDVRLHWPSIHQIYHDDGRSIPKIRQAVERPTQSTLRGRPASTAIDDWWLAVVELAAARQFRPDNNQATILKKVDSHLKKRGQSALDRKLVEERLRKLHEVLARQPPRIPGK